MLLRPIALPSPSTTGGTIKLKSPHGRTYNSPKQSHSFTKESGSRGEYTRGETSTLEPNDIICLEADINTEIVVPEVQEVPVQSGSIIKIEIVRSIVYGGLTELIASLGIVTSSASTTATTGKIVAVSLASLVTGLFVMSYKISELWMKNHETREDEAEVESYENVFGDRRNYRLHFTVAILSFAAFGLVPPLVYGFTFRKPEDKLLKIPTVTFATVVCAAFLGALKAYLKRPSNCVEYVNIIGKYIVDAIGSSVLTTLGGDLIENYIEKIGWFEPMNKIPILFQPSTSFENATWGPY